MVQKLEAYKQAVVGTLQESTPDSYEPVRMPGPVGMAFAQLESVEKSVRKPKENASGWFQTDSD